MPQPSFALCADAPFPLLIGIRKAQLIFGHQKVARHL